MELDELVLEVEVIEKDVVETPCDAMLETVLLVVDEPDEMILVDAVLLVVESLLVVVVIVVDVLVVDLLVVEVLVDDVVKSVLAR